MPEAIECEKGGDGGAERVDAPDAGARDKPAVGASHVDGSDPAERAGERICHADRAGSGLNVCHRAKDVGCAEVDDAAGAVAELATGSAPGGILRQNG